jgi:ribonuclease T2
MITDRFCTVFGRNITMALRPTAPHLNAPHRAANPALEKDGINIISKQGHIQEVRICLSRDLKPVSCGQVVVHDCLMKDAVFTPLR